MPLLPPTDLGLFMSPPTGHRSALRDAGTPTPREPLSFVDGDPASPVQGRANPQAAGSDFWDFLDVINPLQHIPVVSTLYRSVTGDEIGSVPRMMGGAIFGGPVGFLSAAINAALVEDTGKDAGALALAYMDGGGEDASAPDGSDQLSRIETAAGPDSTRPRPIERLADAVAVASTYQAQRFRYAEDDRMAGSQYLFETA